MKKSVLLVFALILSLAVFGGCAEENKQGIPEPKWERNAEEHWKTDENGKKTELGKHEIGHNNVCSVCGSSIISSEDGYLSINDYDENGNMTSCTAVDPDGTVYDYTYEYKENGKSIFSKTYKNGELYMENEYAVDSDGNQISVNSVSYFEDGGKVEAKYNEYGETKESKLYSSEGELLYESVYEYSFLDDGTYYLSSELCQNYEEIRIFEYFYNERGDEISYSVYRLDNHNLVTASNYEYEYDEEGRKTYKKTLENGSLREEFFYENYEDEGELNSYCSKYIYYNPTGNYSVYEYNELGETISTATYDTFGNKIP